MYVVLEWNQASGKPECFVTDVYDDSGPAIELAADALAETKSYGRRERYSVHELVTEPSWSGE